MIQTETYPVFEANQVLSYEHLNDLVRYLERQERATRHLVIGCGIVCGLNIRNDRDRRIIIEPGVALTSTGFLAHLETKHVCEYYRKYDDPVAYARFQDDAGPASLWELLVSEPTDDSPANPLTKPFLRDKAVILYLESNDEDLDRCLADNCLNQGKAKRLIWRPLLIEKARLRRILSTDNDLPKDSNESVLRSRLFGRFNLEDVHVKRPLLVSESVADYASVTEQYLLPAVDAIDALEAAASAGYEAFRHDVLAHLNDDDLVPDMMANIRNAGQDIANGDALGAQQFHEHLRHLAAAWNEFTSAAFLVAGACMPSVNHFPYHIMLNAAKPEPGCVPPLYRQPFLPNPQINGRATALRCARERFDRFVAMAATFLVPEVDVTRITPSKDGRSDLCDRAIPYYYEYPSTAAAWNCEDAARCRPRQALSYHAVDSTADERARQPLKYALDDQDFFRIEGHLARKSKDVMAELERLHIGYNLPFRIIEVSLGELLVTDTGGACGSDDLLLEYRLTRAELLCQFLILSDFLYAATRKDSLAGPAMVVIPGPMFDTLNLYTSKLRWFDIHAEASGGGANSSRRIRRSGINSSSPANAAIPTGRALEAILPADVNISKVGELLIDYPIIDFTVYEFLTPAELAESLMQELSGRLLELPDLLPENLLDLDLKAFTASLSAMLGKAADLRAQVELLLADPEHKKQGFESELLAHLYGLTRHCEATRLSAIVTELVIRREKQAASRTLANMLQDHPGLEHQGGVPRGGTFVLVTAPRSVMTEIKERPFDYLDFRADFSTHDLRHDRRESAVRPTRERNAPGGTNTLSRNNANAASLNFLRGVGAVRTLPDSSLRLLDSFGIDDGLLKDDTRRESKIVVADFCLPYLCCSECREISYIVAPQLSLMLPLSEFCKGDVNRYAFTVSPPGGTVTGPGVVLEGGIYYFAPGMDDVGLATQRFTYTHQGREATLDVSVREAPIADFHYDVRDLTIAGATVSFINRSTGASSLTWDFGDGTEPLDTDIDTDPDHYYDLRPGQRHFEVTLTASHADCSATISQKLDLTAISLTIEADGNKFCQLDKTHYRLIGTPAGGTYEGEGVEQDHFTPALLQPSDEIFRQITITYSVDGNSTELTLDVVSPPMSAFAYHISRQENDLHVSFRNKTPHQDSCTFEWRRNGTTFSTDATPPPIDWNGREEFEIQLVALRHPCPPNTSSQTITKPRGHDDLVALVTEGRARLDTLRNDSHFGTLLSNDRVITATIAADLERLEQATASSDALRTYLHGENDLALAKDSVNVFTAVSDRILDSSADLPQHSRRYLWKFYQLQSLSLVQSVRHRTVDIASGGPIALAFDTMQDQIEKMRADVPQGRRLFRADPKTRRILMDDELFADKPILAAKIANLRAVLS